MSPERIVWHHSADASKQDQFQKINNHHRDRGFPVSSLGYHVGYHWLIEPNGLLRQARRETEIGAHDTGENLNSIGVCLAGDFTRSMPSEEQLKTAATLIAGIRQRWAIPVARIEPHRWDDDTQCPGSYLADNFIVKEYLRREGSPFLRLYLAIGERFNLL